MAETFKSPRPLPLLVNESTFSHKKREKELTLRVVYLRDRQSNLHRLSVEFSNIQENTAKEHMQLASATMEVVSFIQML